MLHTATRGRSSWFCAIFVELSCRPSFSTGYGLEQSREATDWLHSLSGDGIMWRGSKLSGIWGNRTLVTYNLFILSSITFKHSILKVIKTVREGFVCFSLTCSSILSIRVEGTIISLNHVAPGKHIAGEGHHAEPISLTGEDLQFSLPADKV